MKDTIVLYPAPGLGHMVSVVELGKLILRRHNSSFTVNILITTGFLDSPSADSYLHSVPQAHPSIAFHRFPPLSADTSLPRSPAAVAFEFIRLNDSNVRHSLQKISQTSTIRALVIDFFCTSALPNAAEIGIPTYYFFSSGAAALAAFLYFPTIHKDFEFRACPESEPLTCRSQCSIETTLLIQTYYTSLFISPNRVGF